MGILAITRGAELKTIYGSQRAVAWRNMMVAAINAGLAAGLFGLSEHENAFLLEGYDRYRTPGNSHALFDFELAGARGRGYVGDAGFGELSIHASLWPAPGGDRWLRCSNGNFHAGEAFAWGWLERRDGVWLQSNAPGSCISVRREKLAVVAGAQVNPHGYRDRGPLKI